MTFRQAARKISARLERVPKRANDCSVAEAVSKGLLRLPFFNDMTETEQAQAVAAVKDFGTRN